MDLDTVCDDQAICFGHVSVNMHRDTARRFAEHDGIHRRAQWTASAAFGNTQACQDFKLALRGGSTVTAHRRDDKRLAAAVPYQPHQFAGNDVYPGDASTADPNGNL